MGITVMAKAIEESGKKGPIGGTELTGFESILYALFCVSVIFCILVALMLIVKIFSRVLSAMVGEKKAPSATPAAVAVPSPVAAPAPAAHNGTYALKLVGADEQTAAMIMAIVSDESGIPLDNLVFKSIVPVGYDGLKLEGVDEQTAAMAMAIVSDESGIPLDNLIFKSIKAID